MVRNGTGRIVLVSGATRAKPSPREGIMFDNLDGSRFYQPRPSTGSPSWRLRCAQRNWRRRLQAGESP